MDFHCPCRLTKSPSRLLDALNAAGVSVDELPETSESLPNCTFWRCSRNDVYVVLCIDSDAFYRNCYAMKVWSDSQTELLQWMFESVRQLDVILVEDTRDAELRFIERCFPDQPRIADLVRSVRRTEADFWSATRNQDLDAAAQIRGDLAKLRQQLNALAVRLDTQMNVP